MPGCYTFIPKIFRVLDYVSRSHQSDLSKSCKHWDIFLSHCRSVDRECYVQAGRHKAGSKGDPLTLTSYPSLKPLINPSDVNRSALNLVASIPHTDPWNQMQNHKLKSYPKPHAGFCDTEAENPAPNHPNSVSYHAPIPAVSTPPRLNIAPT